MDRRDYLERMIREVADAIASLTTDAQAGRAEEVEEKLDRLWSEKVGLPRELFRSLDPESALTLVGEKKALALRLVEAEIELKNIAQRQSQKVTWGPRTAPCTDASVKKPT